jgi:hypothetical protein
MSSIGSDNFPEQSHQLPDGSWVSLRLDNDYLHTEWTSFSLTFLTGEVQPAFYRVFPAGTQPPDWKPMNPAGEVDHEMDMGDDDSDKDAEETARHSAGKIGAARKLPKGRYVFESKIRVGGQEVQLRAIEFEIRRSPRSAGWG